MHTKSERQIFCRSLFFTCATMHTNQRNRRLVYEVAVIDLHVITGEGGKWCNQHVYRTIFREHWIVPVSHRSFLKFGRRYYHLCHQIHENDQIHPIAQFYFCLSAGWKRHRGSSDAVPFFSCFGSQRDQEKLLLLSNETLYNAQKPSRSIRPTRLS